MTSYHFTCVHSAARIEVNNVLRIWPQKVLGNIPLIWLTPSRSALGAWLGMAPERQTIVTCNRMEVCYRVIEEDEHASGRRGLGGRGRQREAGGGEKGDGRAPHAGPVNPLGAQLARIPGRSTVFP